MSLKLFLYVAICLVLLWSCLCRFKHMNKSTDDWVGFGFTILATAATLAALAPLARYFAFLDALDIGRVTIHWTQLLLMGAFAFVQLSTSKHWRGGVPHAFRKAEEAQHEQP